MKSKIILSLLFGMILLVGIMGSVSAFNWDDGTLKAYYKMDETSGDMKDIVGSNDGTVSANYEATGKINTAYGFVHNDADNVLLDSSITGDTTYSVSFWFYATDQSYNMDILNTNSEGSGDTGIGVGMQSDGNLRLVLEGVAWSTGGSNVDDSAYHHGVLTRNGNQYYVYLDGDSTPDVSYNNAGGTFGAYCSIGSKPGGSGNNLQGSVDEVGYWDRVLNSTEISELYNSGDGLAYAGAEVDVTSIKVTLLSPTNETTITTTGTNFSSNFSITGDNPYNYTWINATYSVWDSDGNIFNSTSVNLPSENKTNFTLFIDDFSLGNYLWNAFGWYGNDTFTNSTWSSEGNFSFIVGGKLLSVEYSNDTYETKKENFIFNVELLEGSSVSLARLNYNGTNYVITNISSVGAIYTFTKSIYIPLNLDPSANQTNSFYLTFIYEGDVTQQFSSYDQVVQPIILTNCTTGTFFINLSLRDEKTLNLLDNSNNITMKINVKYYLDNLLMNKIFSKSFNSNNISLCFTPATETITLFGEIEYEDQTHVKRRYYFIKDKFTNSTTLINLYDLLSTDSSSFIIYLYDVSSIAVQNVFVKLKKKYIESNDFKIVEMAKTDEFGIGVLHFVSEDDIYKITYHDEDGNLLYAPAEFHAVCLDTICSITHTIPYEFASNPFSSLTEDPNFNYTLSSTNNLISLTYNSVDGTTYYDVLLEVDGLSIINDPLKFCSQSLTESMSGTLECNITTSTYNNHQVKVWVDGELEISQYISKENEDYKSYGKEGIIYTLLIVLILALLFIWDWALCLIGAIVGIVLSTALHFIPGTISSIACLIVLVVYIIITGGKE